MNLKKYYHIIFFGLLVVVVAFGYYMANLNPNSLLLESGEILHNPVREELHRYFGFEALVMRYFTLPYDISVNMNQRSSHIDIGYVFFICFAFIVLFKMRSNLIAMIFFGLFTSLIIVFALGNGLILRVGAQNLSSSEQFLSFLKDGEFGFSYLLAMFYYLAHSVYDLIDPFIQSISRDKDYISYPLIILFFCYIGYWLYKSLQSLTPEIQSSILFIYSYSFFWLILSAGVIWYGNIVLFLYCFLIVWAISHLQKKTTKTSNFAKWSLLSIFSSFLLILFVSRISNITLQAPREYWGKEMIAAPFYNFMVGNVKDEDTVIDQMNPGLSKVMEEFNSNPTDKIYRIGTSLTYFIKDNQKRVVVDNQLASFDWIQRIHVYPDAIVDHLKKQGIRYLLVDLNTPTLDKTPEKSLQKKYENFSNFVNGNDRLRLIATDRIAERTRENGEIYYIYDLQGKGRYRGSYAAFELL